MSETRSRLGHSYNKSVKNRTRMQLRSGTILSCLPTPVRTRVKWAEARRTLSLPVFGFMWPRPCDCPSICATTFNELITFGYDQLKKCDHRNKHQSRLVMLTMAETLMRSDRELIQASFQPVVNVILNKLREASLAACNPPDLCAYIKELERLERPEAATRDAGEYSSYSPCDPKYSPVQ